MTIQIRDTHAYSFIPSDIEPNNPSGKTGSKSESIKLGTFIRLVPDALPDSKTIDLEFERERRRLLGVKKHTGPDKQTQKVPQSAIDEIVTSCPIPDGKTLLIAGKKITEQIEILSEVPLLRDLPLVGWLFSSSTPVEQTRHLLILVKPVVAPEKKAQARRVPEPPPLDPDDPLVKKLEEKLRD